VGDSLKAISRDIEEYDRLCKKYGEKSTEGGLYGGHRKALALRERKEQDATQRRLRNALCKHWGVSDVGGLAAIGHLLVFAKTNSLGRQLKKITPKEFEGIRVEVVGPYQRPIH